MRVIFFFILSLSFFKSFADAGYAYRFYAEVTLKNDVEISGYIYHNSYNTFNIEKDSLLDFLKVDNRKNIKLYTHIVPFNVNHRILDFSSSIYGIFYEIEDIDNIVVVEKLDFINGNKIIELSEDEFSIIKSSIPKIKSIYQDNISEHCKSILITWKESKYLDKINEEFLIFIEKRNATSNINIKSTRDFFDSKKEDLLKHKILLINYCEAL